MDHLIGQQLGPYQVQALIGEGATATVFRAYHPRMGRPVALKVLHNPKLLTRFEQEAKVLANLHHPYLLPVYDFGQARGYTYLIMRLLENGTVADLIRRGPIPLERVCAIVSQVGAALDYAHRRAVIHRDVKPGNILLDDEGNCLLADFGIAKSVASELTHPGAVMGTPAYMSPEQGRGEPLDGRSDSYALGVMLFELITGRKPYAADSPMALIQQHLQAPVPSPRRLKPELPAGVEPVVLKAMAKQPEDRYATAGELAEALRRAVPGAVSGPSSFAIEPLDPATVARTVPGDVSAGPDQPPRSSRPRWLPVVLAAIPLILSGVGAVAVLAYLFSGGLFPGPDAIAEETGASVRTRGTAISTPTTPPPATALVGVTAVSPATPTHEPSPQPTHSPVLPTPTPTLTPSPSPSPVLNTSVAPPRPPASVEATLPPEGFEPPMPTSTRIPASPPPPRNVPASPPEISGKLALPIFSPEQDRYDLYILSLPQGEVVSLIPGARQPNFRGDGQKLLVNAERGDQGEENIYEANPLTGSFERRVSDSDIDFHPFYNPAGDRVVYGRNDGQRFLYVQCDLTPPSQATVTGCNELTDIRLIPADPKEIWGTNPVWTADDHIVYKGCALAGNPCGLLQVESWAAKHYNNQTGINPAPLVLGSTETIPTDTKANLVAYQDYDPATGHWEALVVLPTADRQIVKIAASPDSDEGLPTLSPDGRWVAFVSNRDGAWAVYVVPLEAGSVAAPVKLTTPPLRWDTRGDRDWKTERLSWGP